MEIFAEVRRSLKVKDAVEAELGAPGRLLPPRWGDLALTSNGDAVVVWLTSLMRRDFRVCHEDMLLARKLGRGARPLSLLGLQERILYRGLVSLIENSSHILSDRSHDAYEAFQKAPLQIEDCRYVLKTDITAYYQYVDHERLVDEVVTQTGDDLVISTVVELLNHAMGRAYGLPQLSDSSNLLSEIYIEPMRRALVRSGFAVSRFADDFRVACRSYDEALSAWETADNAARDLGLVLNESKTSTPGKGRYAASLTAVRDQEKELFDALAVEDLDEPEYSDSDDTDHVTTLIDGADFDEGEAEDGSDESAINGAASAAQLTAAGEILNRWLAEEEDEETQRQEAAHVTTALLGRALRVFASGYDARAIEHVAILLVYEPSLTPTIARYMLRCSESDRTAVRNALDEVCGKGIVNAWQAVWMAYVAGGLPRRRLSGRHFEHIDWLERQCQSSNPAVAAEAILALARRRLVRVDAINAVLNRLTSVQRPTGVVALAAVGSESEALDAASSELDRLRVAWAAEHL
jgi:hypothetical protein